MKILLIVYDNDMFINFMPIGLAYIAAILRDAGHDVEIYSQDVHRYPSEHLTQYLNDGSYDVVGVSFVAGYYPYRKILEISKAVNASHDRPFYILGGHGPSPEPEYFLKKTQADAVVIGEGEVTIIELLDALSGKKQLSEVKGIAYRTDNIVTINERRALIEDIDTIPFPAYDLFPIQYYRLMRGIPNTESRDFVMPVLSGRGCPFKCTFCYRMDEGYRPRSNVSIIDEIKLLKREYNINFITFQDDLLMTSPERMESICDDMLVENVNVKWHCNGRLNYAKPKTLKLMKKAGCVFVKLWHRVYG